MEQVKQTVQRSAGPVATIGTVGGFVGDVMQPLAPLAQWVAGLALVALIGSGLGWWWLHRQRGQQSWESSMPIVFFISAPTFVIFSLWSLLFAAGPERGYLAENIEPVAQLQAQLLGIEEDVAEIRETTEEIQETTGQTQEEVEAIATQQQEDSQTLGQIDETTSETQADVEAVATAQALGFAEIQAAFASLQSSQSIVENPATPQEWYSNARLYQLRGDTANAIAAFEGYFQFGLEYVDPYLLYVDLLNATEGIARTRERFTEMAGGQPDNLALELVSITLLEDAAERLARLEALGARESSFGPAWVEIMREYRRLLLGGATRDLLAKQEAAYNTLASLEAEQNLSRYYIDKELAAETLETARSQYEEWQISRELTEQPDVTVSHLYNGTLFIVSFTEMGIQELRVSVDDPNPTQTTGSIAAGPTGSMANPSAGPVLVEPGEHIFYFQYVDANGVTSPVFEVPFTVYPISIQYTQLPGDFTAGVFSAVFALGLPWVADGTIYTYQYSLDSPALDQSVIGVPMTSITLEDLTEGEHTLFIQGTGDDGTVTELVEFPFVVQ